MMHALAPPPSQRARHKRRGNTRWMWWNPRGVYTFTSSVAMGIQLGVGRQFSNQVQLAMGLQLGVGVTPNITTQISFSVAFPFNVSLAAAQTVSLAPVTPAILSAAFSFLTPSISTPTVSVTPGLLTLKSALFTDATVQGTGQASGGGGVFAGQVPKIELHRVQPRIEIVLFNVCDGLEGWD